MSRIGLLSPAASTPSPSAFLTVKPVNRTWELPITTPAKMVCVPSPGMLTRSVGVTPASSMVACWPTRDSALNWTWELRMTTAAKMVCVPSRGMLTFSVGVTPTRRWWPAGPPGTVLGDRHLLVVGPLAHDDGAPRGGGVDCGLDGPERGGAAGAVGATLAGVLGDVQGAVVTALPCYAGGRRSGLCDRGAGDQHRCQQRAREPDDAFGLHCPSAGTYARARSARPMRPPGREVYLWDAAAFAEVYPGFRFPLLARRPVSQKIRS